jgi:FecR protein
MSLFSPQNREAFAPEADRGHWPNWRAALLAIAVTAIVPSFAAGQPGHLDIGHSIFVVNIVDGQIGDTPPTLLRIGDDIVFQEDISTGAEAKTVIEFRDGSTFEVGPDAVIRIDEFVFNPEESVGHKTLSVTRGVFRYVSGFVANDQDAKIALPQGTIGIRGSVVVGVVDPAVPAFLHVAQGNATFTNDAGSSAIGAGGSIATPSRTTPPMRSDRMPAAVAAQTLQAIERRLPSPAVLRSRPAPGDQQLRREATANLLPAAQQLSLQHPGRPGRPASLPGSRIPVARELGLLAEAQSYHLFDGASPQRTPEQQSFLARAERMDPQAPALIRRSDADARSLHELGATSGTVTVMRGVAAVAPSADVLHRVAAAAARANPAATAIITRTSLESYRGPDRDRAEDLFHHVTAPSAEPRGYASAHPPGRHPVNAEARQKTAKAEQTSKRRRRPEDQQLR